MFSFIKSKTSDLNKRREFIDAHSLYENYSLRFSSSRFLFLWDSQFYSKLIVLIRLLLS